jgi:GNAT superfamily N-acetyltransferase
MPTRALALQTFTAAHLNGAVRLSREVGWPHRHDDWRFMLGMSRGIVALDDDEVVGTALAISFGAVAMTAMIIVDPRMRGRGLGKALVRRAMTLAEPDEWRLVATPEAVPLYEGLGFAAYDRSVLHQGLLAPVAPPHDVAWAEASDEPQIASLDALAFGGDRRALIAGLAGCGGLAVLREDGGVTGYAALRDFGLGEVVGPVVARDAGAAQRLLAFLFAARAGRFLRVDVPSNSTLRTWLAANGLVPASEGIAMRRGALPATSSAFTSFALAAQAFG